MKIIDKLSYENNLSNSKVINLLVEEALVQRGIFNKDLGDSSNIFQDKVNFKKGFEALQEINNNKDLDNLVNKNKSKNTLMQSQENIHNLDLETYQKFILFIQFQEMMNKYEKRNDIA